MKILLDYVFPITVITPTPAASTGFLKQVCIVVAPKEGVTAGTITACTSKTAVAALTANTEADQLFDAGLSKVFVLPASSLDIADALEANAGEFFTVLISSDFDDTDMGAAFANLDVGSFPGVVGYSTADEAKAKAFAAIENQCGFFTKAANGAKNMFFAFGTLLSNPLNWLNQQYITMPVSDDVDALGDANTMFDDKVSFVISDAEFGNRLAMFAVGGKAIVAPYILKNLRIDLQSRALQWISQNEPQFTIKEAALLETRLQEDVINAKYIEQGWIASGTVAISLTAANFTANGAISVPQPKALWRVAGQMTETA